MGSSSSKPSPKPGLFPSKPGDSINLILTFETSYHVEEKETEVDQKNIELMRNKQSSFNRKVLKELPKLVRENINFYTDEETGSLHDKLYNFKVRLKPKDITKVKMSKNLERKETEDNVMKYKCLYQVLITTTLQPPNKSVEKYYTVRGKRVDKEKTSSLEDYMNELGAELEHRGGSGEIFDLQPELNEDTRPMLRYSHFEYAPANCFVRAEGL